MPYCVQWVCENCFESDVYCLQNSRFLIEMFWLNFILVKAKRDKSPIHPETIRFTPKRSDSPHPLALFHMPKKFVGNFQNKSFEVNNHVQI